MNNFYLGGDASKGYSDFIILDQLKRTAEKNFQLDDTHTGHQRLRQILSAFATKHENALLYAGFESTGGYEGNFLNMLKQQKDNLNINVALLNPLGVKRGMEADLTRNKTDKISARAVAEYLIDHPKKIVYNRDDNIASLRRGWQFINMLSKQKASLLNQFESALYNTHPDLLIYCKDGVPDWILNLVHKYPCAAKLAGASWQEIDCIPYIKPKRAKELVENSRQSVGAYQDEAAQWLIKNLAEHIFYLSAMIKNQVKTIKRLCSFEEEIKILTSFKGIAEFSAIGLMLVIDDINRFAGSKKLCSFIGVHPVYKTSGDGSGGYHMSKKGSKQARRLLFNVAMSAIAHNDMIKELYQNYLARGKPKMSAIGIIMHKILRIIYGMLKNKKEYDPKIDEANRKKFGDKSNKTGTDKNRRYQKIDEMAPISKRQTKKRKDAVESRIKNEKEEEKNTPHLHHPDQGKKQEQEESQNDNNH
ncbi:MAG: IS110 family transposase [Candidatus Aminicenantes bacterium]|nr:IS110 family transposase [Candidatus Aminicenantes bacterium]